MSKVSVIIPTYNREKYISEAIDSVLNQTYKDYEIIVVDDGSTDKTKEVLTKYNDKIRYFYQENQGVSVARNKGIKESKGDYIAFLDADDMWLPQHLEKEIGAFETDSKVALVYAQLRVLNKNKIVGIKPTIPVFKVEDFWAGASITTSTVIVKKECFYKVGLFNVSLKRAQDSDMWIKISSCFKIHYIPEVLGIYRVVEDIYAKNSLKIYQNQVHLFKKHLYNPNIKLSSKFKKKILAKEYFLLAKVYLREKKYKEAARNILKAIWTEPFFGSVFINKENINLFSFFKIIKPYLTLSYCVYKIIIKDDKINVVERKIRIFYLEAGSGFGGSANALANLINNLDRDRFVPSVVVKNYGSQIGKIRNAEILKLTDYKEPEKLSNFGFFVYFIMKLFQEATKIYFIIKKSKISLVHVNTNIISGIPAIIASKVSGIPCVCHIRQTRQLIKRERIFAKLVDKFIVLNKTVFEMLKKEIPESKISIIYDGLDLETFQNTEIGIFKKEFNLDGASVVGMIGRIVEGKGHREFILVAKEVLIKKNNTVFLIVGDSKGSNDTYYNCVKDLVKTESLEKNVIFTGWRNDIKNVISDFDILIQCSTFPEGLPNVIIEAMASEKPVVATNIAGSSDIILNGETGFLVPPADIKAMAEKIIYLLDNPSLANIMGHKGRKRVEELFDIRKTVRSLENVYESLLSQNGKNN